MGEKALVESQVDDAVKLIQKLDANALSPTVVVWYYYDEADEWRLLVGGPPFEKFLPRQEAAAYGILIEAIGSLNLSSLKISDLKLVSTASPLAKTLLFVFRTAPTGIEKAYMTNNTVNGIFIKSMVILRSA